MASKLAVAGIIEGNFSEEGLAAMSDVQDMTSQMAKELMLGIRDNVEDIASTFRKMAIVNLERREPEKAVSDPVPEAKPIPASAKTSIIPPVGNRSGLRLTDTVIEAILEKEKTKRHRKAAVDENQMSLFDVA